MARSEKWFRSLGVIVVRSLIILLFSLVLVPAHAADRYVRAGAAGNGSGSDWANAYPSLPATLVRGDTYWIAAGSYGSYTLQPVAGTTPIAIRKATAASHGTDLGWQSAYAGQAIFGDINVYGNYYVFDGAARNEGNWADSASYGFRVNGEIYCSRFDKACGDNVTFRYVSLGSDTTNAAAANGHGIYAAGFGGASDAAQNWTFSRGYIRGTKIHVQCAGCDGLVLEYTYLGLGWGKEAIRGQIHAANLIVRHNVFKDSCQRDPSDATSGCTAEIALWDGSNFDNNQVYGNVFQKTTSEINSGGVVVIGGNGSSWVGPAANNAKIYNNTIVGFRNWHAEILVNGGSGNECRNNLWYDNSGSITGCKGTAVASNNVVASSSPFVNASAGDFRLAVATAPGVALAAPFNVDRNGAARGGDGSWDLGAFEFGSGSAALSPAALSAPSNLRLLP
jgi:hypothetical protein